jgi:EpsI family protein
MKLQAILALLCLLTAGAASMLTPHNYLAEIEPVNLEQMVPAQFGGWQMEQATADVITSPEQDAAVKNIYSQVLSRSYINSQGNRVMLSIAYTRDQSDNSGKQSHRPEICYPAQGFSITSSQKDVLTTPYGVIPVRHLVAEQGNRIEPITYWTTAGTQVAISGLEMKKAQIGYGLQGIISDGLLFRISTIGADIHKEYQVQQAFIDALMANMPANARKRMAGL